MSSRAAVSFLSLFLLSCTAGESPAISSKTYFDIQGYFKSEAARLEKKDPFLDKTVAKNELNERKRLKISDWTKELELFGLSDINKAAWSRSYRKTAGNGMIRYAATEKDLKTQEIIIYANEKGETQRIYILNKMENALYSSSEELNYYPDSLYSIHKKQHIILLGDNDYQVIGRFQ